MCDVKPVFKNELISLQYEDIRFGMYDSDGRYADYLFYTEDEENPDNSEKEYINQLKNLDEKELAKWIEDAFDVLKFEPERTEIDFKKLRSQWGDEYVCRIGNTAIIIRE